MGRKFAKVQLDDNTATISYGADTGFSSTRPAVATLALELGTNLNSNVPVVLPDQNIGSNNSLTIDADAFNSGTDVFFKLGDIVNNDSDANDETITIEFNALVDNNATANSNDAGDIRDNTFVYLIGGATTGTLSNNMRLRIVEPALSSSKTVTPASADAGDSVTYTITLANASGVNVSTAYDVNLTDIMPAELTNIVLQTPTTAGGASGASANLVGQTITLGVADMPPGSSVTLQYTADLTTSVSSGQQLTNTASTTYTSLPGTNGTANGQPGNATGSSNTATPGTLRGERTGTNPVVAPNDLVTSANATVTVFVPAPQKTLVSTSEADTATTDVAIGEIVRYRLLVRLAEGVSPAVQLRDNLPAGLKLLQDGTVRFGFVSNGAGISSSDTAINSCADVNATPTSGTTLPCALPAANIDTSSIPIFNLGDLTNSDTDADEEYVLLEFNALVENISTNNLGTSLNNTFTVLINATERATSTGLPVIVAEPVITNLTKSVQAQSPLAVGSSVSYLLSFSNTGTAPTYNLRVTDTLDNRLALTAVTVTSQPGYASTDTSATSGNNAIITIDKLSPGDSITIKLTATLQTLPSPGTIPNQADLGYTSLPGNNGSTGNLTGSDNPGTPGTADGERTGVVGDPVNDLIDSDTENLPLGMIGDLIWFDSNANGLQDVGEIGLKNVKVTLTGPGQDGIAGNADDVSASLLTSATGAYLFQGLLPGSYTVTVDETTLPTGMLISADPDGAPLSSTFSLTLADAEERRTVDFGYTGNASLGDYVWLDQNADQLQNATEDGIAGVSVTALWAGQDGDFGTVADNVSYTTTTDVNGAYLFQNLAAGNYRVSVNTGSLPAGVTPSYDLDGIATAHTTLASVSAGTANLTADFGYTGTASVGDLVWYDLDGDGNKDANEQGLANVTVTVIWYGPDNTLGTADDSSFTTTTDANGLYKVEGLPAGRYTVTTSNLPAGALPSYDLDGTGTPNSSVVTLSANTYTDLVDFGYKGGLSIGDHLWFDKNANRADDGAANGETGLANVTITLTYYGADGVSGGGDDVSVTTQTDPNGNYSFSGLLQGNYNVTVDESSLPAGLSISADPDAGTLSSSYNLTLSADRLDVDFGYKANASIGDRVWFDQNGNGIQDAAEGGIEGVQVILLDGAGNPTGLSTLTDPNGYYACTDLAAGSYQVEFILPAQYRFSPTGQGTSATDSDANSTTGRTAITTLTQQNESVTTLDAGLYEPVGFGDQIWNDINNDGLLSAGETGVANVVIDLYRDDNGDGQPSAAEFVGTTTSDPSGLYGFSDLRPGDYIAVLPAVNFAIGGPLEGMVSSTGEYVPGGSYVATPDPDDDIDDDNNGMLLNGVILSKPFTLHSQTEPFGRDEDPNTNMTIDFGVFKPARLGSLVWEDSDKDGIRDEGEAGVANITVTLYDAQNRVIGTTRTDANGGYVFNNLPPGSYSIGFSNLPDAYVFTEQDKGNDDGLDSDVDPVSARTSAVTLAPGDNNLSINAGIYKTPPTAIVLSRFTASWADTHILVEWKTEAELNTWGYQIYRSATGKRADAELLTQQAIPGRGRGGQGASYSWVDSNIVAGTEYSYWLVELEMDGSAHEYGPARAAIQQQGLVHIHLPMIGR